MMIYHTLEARCPRCQYTTTVRPDFAAQYEAQCPSCGHPAFDQSDDVYYLSDVDKARVQRMLDSEFNV